jgi:DNA-binding FadR family transcriptional regulator
MLFEQLAAAIERQILSGELSPGDRLPAEGALAEEYGVSRPVVREALARLRERHLLETRNGNGTFIRHPSAGDLTEVLLRHLRFASSGPEAVAHLYEARVAIESMTAQLAAARASNADLEEMQAHIETMRDHQTAEADWTRADLAFHHAMARATHNPLLATLLDPLTQLIEDSIRAGHRDPRAVRRGLEAHERIWEALKARDADKAVAAVRDHLADSKARRIEMLRAAQRESEES